MIYRIYCDGLPLYHTGLESLQIFSPSIELELNKTGSFDFVIYPNHAYYNALKKLKSIITVYQDDYLLFRGRVLDVETGFYNEKKVSCEGELAFLLDSIQRPYEYSGTVAGYLNLLVTAHNAQVDESKWFTVGNVTVTDNNDYIVRSNIDYVDTWTEMQDKLVKLLGGYIVVRHDGWINYIDYLQDFNLLAPQKIEFGKNLLDLKRASKGADICTALIPLGAKLKDAEGKDTDERLTIATVNDGADFVQDAEAVAQYGFIVKTAVFDDITEAQNLLAKGNAELARLVNAFDSLEISAADMAAVGADFSSFHLGTYAQVTSKPHGIDQRFLVQKLAVNPLEPAANKLVLNGSIAPFSGAVQGLTDGQRTIRRDIENAVRRQNEAVLNLEQNLESSLIQTAENIQATVAEKYYLKDDTDALVSEISTQVEQTKESVNIQFTQFSADIESVAAGTDAQFEEIKKYIRFIDGKILLGEVGNELELQIANDRISFLQDGAEVAYFSDRKLFVTDAQFLHSLQLGSFAFMPRANGNLSFKKI